MPTYFCSECKYASSNHNVKRHIKYVHTDIEPVPTVITVLESKVTCIFCNNFTGLASKLRLHEEKCVEFGTHQAIINYRTKFGEMEGRIRELNEQVVYLKDELAKAGSIVQQSMSTIQFICQNYNQAPPLKSLTNFAAIYTDYPVDGNANENNIKFVEEIISKFRHKTLAGFIGEFIIKNYKCEDSKKQSIWNTDAGRFSYIIRQLVESEEVIWQVDKKGVKTKQFIIDPVLKYIDNEINIYIKSFQPQGCNRQIFLNIKATNDRLAFNSKLCDSHNIKTEINDGLLHDEVLKIITPKFHINSNRCLK
jgi:hypothetical protein